MHDDFSTGDWRKRGILRRVNFRGPTSPVELNKSNLAITVVPAGGRCQEQRLPQGLSLGDADKASLHVHDFQRTKIVNCEWGR